MRDKEGKGTDVLDEGLEGGVGDGSAIVCARAAAQLIHDDEGAGGCTDKDVSGLL